MQFQHPSAPATTGAYPPPRGRRSAIAACGAAVLLVVGAQTASAHVTVTPSTAPANTSQELMVRVPTEKEVPTIRVRVEFPGGLTVSRFKPLPGWNREVERDSQQRITSVTWSGGQVAPGEYMDFPFMARTPADAGKIAFRALQTYQGGEVVEWTGAEGTERPAAILTVGAAPAAAPADDHGAASTPATVAAPAAAQSTNVGSDLPLLLALVALALGAIALVVSLVGLGRGRSAAATGR
jgi:uncharacterized protein YcnI